MHPPGPNQNLRAVQCFAFALPSAGTDQYESIIFHLSWPPPASLLFYSALSLVFVMSKWNVFHTLFKHLASHSLNRPIEKVTPPNSQRTMKPAALPELLIINLKKPACIFALLPMFTLIHRCPCPCPRPVPHLYFTSHALWLSQNKILSIFLSLPNHQHFLLYWIPPISIYIRSNTFPIL